MHNEQSLDLPWREIDHILLDMDGTLLDLHFDNHFWLEHVPSRYAEARGLSVEETKKLLPARYTDILGTLQWYCVDHWSRELGLDIALLKQEIEHLIAVHPHVIDFLQWANQSGKQVWLVTNAHQKSLALKMEKTQLAGYFHRIVCSHDIGLPKEHPDFWDKVREIEPFDPSRSLFVDDSPPVLAAARDYGIGQLLQILAPDSKLPVRERGEFPAVRDFSQLIRP
jgi:putative hydrolase of the HAD superfamily